MENKTGRYLKYAIGEVILVVIGILIALQINNWNEGRKTQLRAQVYINGIVNDLETDIVNITALTNQANDYKKNIDDYFSYFNQGNVSIEKLITSSRNVGAGYIKYFPVNNTFLDMQASGNTNLLNEAQRHALIKLSSEQEQLQSIIEKVINSSIRLDDKKNGYLGYPDDLFEKLGQTASENNKLHWLINQHLLFSRNINLYYYIDKYGKIITETSKNTISILKGNDT